MCERFRPWVAPTLPPWAGERARIRFPELTPADAVDGLAVELHLADAGLLPMLEVPLVAGRHLRESDDRAAAVAVVSRALADRLGGPDAAVGRALDLLPRRAGASGRGAHRRRRRERRL